MTPYDEGTTVTLDPVKKLSRLKFGPLDDSYKELIGVIEKREYFQPGKTMAYLVRFEGKEPAWFIEKELLTVYKVKR